MADGTTLLRKSSLGDVVLLGSITGAVQRPVTVVTDARFLPVARRLRGVDEVRPWDDPGRLTGRVVDLQGSLASRRMAPGAARIRKRSVRRRAWLWWGVGSGRPDVPTLYGEAAGVVPWAAPWIDVPREVRDTLVLIPGAAWRLKAAPLEALVACGEAWSGRVVVLGSAAEEALVAKVVDAIPRAEGLAEEGFEETLRVLARGKVCVSGDTGLLHLAAACGVVPVGLFGPTHPADGFFPYRGQVVQRALPCRPCALHRVRVCRMGDEACREHDVDEVVAAMRACAG